MNQIVKKMENLKISPVTNDVLLVHQIDTSASTFASSDGLLILPKPGRNTKTVALDLNLEPDYVRAVNKEYGPVSHYVNSHGHVDHTSHVHAWEEFGATIYAPIPEAGFLIDLREFYQGFGWNERFNFSTIEEFSRLVLYQACKRVTAFNPGDVLTFEGLTIETIPLPGHTSGHTGFLLPAEKILHISCLGFDQVSPGADGFGPWYGFRQCSIPAYFKSIDLAESHFLERADYLTSSHAYIVRKSDTAPFAYIRKKINDRQEVVDRALETLKGLTIEDQINRIVGMDLIYQKKKMEGFMLDVYTFWEYWMIRHHIECSGLNSS